MIGLTITTCKRIDLFERTILTFVSECEDCNLIDVIIHYDDSSSLDDRNKMFTLLNTLFPDTLIISKRFNPDSFNTNRRHLEIMKKWKEDIKFFNIDYVFHLEDDWLFEIIMKLLWLDFHGKKRYSPKSYLNQELLVIFGNGITLKNII